MRTAHNGYGKHKTSSKRLSKRSCRGGLRSPAIYGSNSFKVENHISDSSDPVGSVSRPSAGAVLHNVLCCYYFTTSPTNRAPF